MHTSKGFANMQIGAVNAEENRCGLAAAEVTGFSRATILANLVAQSLANVLGCHVYFQSLSLVASNRCVLYL